MNVKQMVVVVAAISAVQTALIRAQNLNPAYFTNQGDAAVLSVASGFPNQPGGANPLAGRAMLLMKESFGQFLKRTGMFQGPPGSPNRLSPLATWAESCRAGMPVCQQTLYEARASFVSNAKLDINGKAVFPGVPPGTYYILMRAVVNNQHLVWDLRVDLRPGANSITLNQQNVAPLVAELAPAKPPSGGSETGAGSQPCNVPDVPRAIKPGGLANSNLSVIGIDYVYTHTTTDRRTGAVVDSFTERGKFSNTTLYLLDEDADTILQKAGVEPGLLGSRLAMLTLFDAGTQVGKAPAMDLLSSILGQPGAAAEMSKLAKADYDCAMKAIRSHSLAEITTDANARGTFAGVPAGTYYVFGRFYRITKPVRGGGLLWNSRVELKPGQNTFKLNADDAALK